MMLVSEHLFWFGALPLAEAGGGMLDEVKEPGFAQWVVYLIVLLYVVEKVGGGVMKLTGREVPALREISGTMTTVPETRHAEQSEVDELREEVRDLREENQGQHNAASLAGTQRVAALSEVIESRTGEIEKKLDESLKDLLKRMDDGFAAMSRKLDPLTVEVARHDTHLVDLVPRILRVETRLSESTQNLHNRINDLIQKPKR